MSKVKGFLPNLQEIQCAPTLVTVPYKVKLTYLKSEREEKGLCARRITVSSSHVSFLESRFNLIRQNSNTRIPVRVRAYLLKATKNVGSANSPFLKL